MLNKSLFLLFSSAVLVFAQNLSFQQGSVMAHTEVFGESNINPKTTFLHSKLTMDSGVESIKGDLVLDLASLKSDNEKRDEHMYETLKVKAHPSTSFKIQAITKEADGYHIAGMLTLNQKPQEINTKADISEKDGLISLKGDFQIKLTDFGLEPPTMLFLTVRDLIDIHYDVTFKTEK